MSLNKWTVLAFSAGVASMLAGCAPRGDFALFDLNGQKVSLSDQKGKAVLLSFWAVG